MNNDGVILCARVDLARNYQDLPFALAEKPREAERCTDRTRQALAALPGGCTPVRLAEESPARRRALAARGLIRQELLRVPQTAALLLSADERLAVMLNGGDHLRIRSLCPGDALEAAADRAFQAEDMLARQEDLAFDPQLGYLTADPAEAGTGLRACLLLHLPMLARSDRLEAAGRIAREAGLTLRGVQAGDNAAAGDVYCLCNRATLGHSEEEFLKAVTGTAHRLRDLETALRTRALTEDRAATEDAVFRAMALLRSARLMQLEECFRLWSAVQVGLSLQLLTEPVPQDLPWQVQDALLDVPEGAEGAPLALQQARADRIRAILQA